MAEPTREVAERVKLFAAALNDAGVLARSSGLPKAT